MVSNNNGSKALGASIVPEPTRKEIENLIEEIMQHGRRAERNDSPYHHAPEVFVVKLRNLLERQDKESRIDEHRVLWKAIVPMITGLPDSIYLLVKDAFYNRGRELKSQEDV